MHLAQVTAENVKKCECVCIISDFICIQTVHQTVADGFNQILYNKYKNPFHLLIATAKMNAKQKERKKIATHFLFNSMVLWMVVAVCWFFEWIMHSCTYNSSQNNEFHILNVPCCHLHWKASLLMHLISLLSQCAMRYASRQTVIFAVHHSDTFLMPHCWW